MVYLLSETFYSIVRICWPHICTQCSETFCDLHRYLKACHLSIQHSCKQIISTITNTASNNMPSHTSSFEGPKEFKLL